MRERVPYDRFRVSPLDPAKLRAEDVERTLQQLATESGGRLKVEKFAESYQGRPIYLTTIGSGPKRVLLWSQMHGDEPTHTAVLLDLLSYLTKHADDLAAVEILAGVTLMAIPMLNPDGAAAFTRFNGQGIDINRDSQRRVTVEGQTLYRAVETLKPEFGFNLHNQNARTAIGIPPKPAAVALMAPPIDAADTETPQVQAAKQVAVCFARGARPQAEGMIGRYVAEYMPWAFGEKIQSMGVVTVLVEAGGWPGPDPAPLVEVHFNGLVAALGAIATGAYRDVDASEFDRLPRDNELKLCDVAVVGGRVGLDEAGEAVRADLGINHSHGIRLFSGQRPDGRIVDIGDLGTSSGKQLIDAANSLIRPGRLVVLEDWWLGQTLSAAAIDELLAQGVTTVVGFIARETDPRRAIDLRLPFNFAFARRVTDDGTPSDSSWKAFQKYEWATSRGKIRRELIADLVLHDAESSAGPGVARRVIVAGEAVWVDGQRTGMNAGAFLGFVEECRPC